MTDTICHSPAPWIYEPSDFSDSYFQISNGFCTIAEVERWNADNDAVTMAEAEANACLIAAAPSLLEILEMVANNYAYLLETKMTPQDADAIHKVIAKAKET